MLYFMFCEQVTVHKPICREDGNLELALYGSFLPVPSVEVFDDAAEMVITELEKQTLAVNRSEMFFFWFLVDQFHFLSL